MQRGEYLRAASLHLLPPTIPQLNRDAWQQLARASANLNQIAHAINFAQLQPGAEMPPLTEVAEAVGELRRALIGARFESGK